MNGMALNGMLPRVATLFMLSKYVYARVMDLYDSAWVVLNKVT